MKSDVILKEQEEILQLVSFRIGAEIFAIEILIVNEIINYMDITKLPNQPPFVEGIINLRSKVIPVINLRTKLGMETIENNSSTKIIVVHIKDKEVGFKVDAVCEVMRIPKSITEATPELVSTFNRQYITAVGKVEDKLIILLDLDKVISGL